MSYLIFWMNRNKEICPSLIMKFTGLKKLLPFYAFCFAMIFVTSCVTVNLASLQRLDKEGLPVYTTQIPDRNYVELFYIEASGGIFHRPEKLMSKLNEKAKAKGADALINVKFDFQYTWPIASATAIKFVEN